MDYEKLLIVLAAFGFVTALFPYIVSAIGGISLSEPLKWIFDFIPYAFLGSFLLAVIAWGFSSRE